MNTAAMLPMQLARGCRDFLRRYEAGHETDERKAELARQVVEAKKRYDKVAAEAIAAISRQRHEPLKESHVAAKDQALAAFYDVQAEMFDLAKRLAELKAA